MVFSQREKEEEGEIDPGFLITHKIGLEDGPDAYTMVQEKNDGCIKVVINPEAAGAPLRPTVCAAKGRLAGG